MNKERVDDLMERLQLEMLEMMTALQEVAADPDLDPDERAAIGALLDQAEAVLDGCDEYDNLK